MYYRFSTAVLTLAALALAAWHTITLALADVYFRQQTPESVARAIQLQPENTSYLAFAALQSEYGSGKPRGDLEAIARLNPRLAAPRIRLGLAAEIDGNVAAAERWLLEAASVDRQFETRWTLANFYFRQDQDAFWTWIQSALEFSYGDRKPAFDLCWLKSSDAREILERAMPDRPDVLAAYVQYASREKRAEAIAPAALRLAALSRQEGPLLDAVDSLLDLGRTAEAAQVWTAAGLATPSGVFNPRFDHPGAGRGFDWRYARAEGVTHLALEAGGGHRVRLSGNQPEACELLRQTLWGLKPGAKYRLRWQHRADGFPEVSGIAWRVGGNTAPLEAREAIITASAGSAALVLFYERPRGQVRAEGSVDLLEIVAEPTF